LANKNLFQEQLAKAGAQGVEIEYVLETGSASAVEAVAEVFGIM
jgi:hypothetical protein